LESFNQIILSFQSLVYNQAYRIIGEPDAAADATQEAFISAYKKLHTYRGGSFKSWLLRIVSNACYDEYRRRKRKPVVPLYPEGEDGDEMDSASWLEDPSEKPEDTVQRRELSEAIQYCLDRLNMSSGQSWYWLISRDWIMPRRQRSPIVPWVRLKAVWPGLEITLKTACGVLRNFYPWDYVM